MQQHYRQLLQPHRILRQKPPLIYGSGYKMEQPTIVIQEESCEQMQQREWWLSCTKKQKQEEEEAEPVPEEYESPLKMML